MFQRRQIQVLYWVLKIDLKVSRFHKYSLGTVNIHPSLLPLYRGAAPVQRALQVVYLFHFSVCASSWTFCFVYKSTLQDGVKETGVSLLFTVQALDAGPVIARERLSIDNSVKVSKVFIK